MYDLLPLPWSRSGAPMLRCTRCAICCRCFGLDLLPLLWSRSGVPMLRCTICCRCFGLAVGLGCRVLKVVDFGVPDEQCLLEVLQVFKATRKHVAWDVSPPPAFLTCPASSSQLDSLRKRNDPARKTPFSAPCCHGAHVCSTEAEEGPL